MVMIREPMDTLVIHDDDFDGWGARYAAWKHFKDGAEYLAIDHGKWQEEVPWHLLPEETTDIYLLDYSWPAEDLLEIGSVHDLTVIDHHESFLQRLMSEDSDAVLADELHSDVETAYQGKVREVTTYDEMFGDGRFTLCFDEDHAAATLTWRYFHQSEAPKLLKHIEDRDLWNWEMEHTDEILLALDSKEQSVEVYDRFARQPDRLISAGHAIATYRDKQVARLVEEATIREAEIEGETYTLALVNSPLLQSEIGEAIREEYPEADIALIFFVDDLAEGALMGGSLRSSSEGPNVGQIAQALGGGGHDNAAGFSTTVPELSLEGTPQQIVQLD